jgi:hypothetical protein
MGQGFSRMLKTIGLDVANTSSQQESQNTTSANIKDDKHSLSLQTKRSSGGKDDINMNTTSGTPSRHIRHKDEDVEKLPDISFTKY